MYLWQGQWQPLQTRVPPPRFERHDLLAPEVMLPAIDHAVLVQEALADAQAQIDQLHTTRVDEAFGAMHPSVNDEAVSRGSSLHRARPVAFDVPQHWCCRCRRAGATRSVA
jgi:hypothetical protein